MKKFEEKLWLATPTMHGDELEYIKVAFDENYITTAGENINEVERLAAEKIGCKYAVALSCCTAALHLAVKLAGEQIYGKPEIGKGTLQNRRVFCSDMTFDATVNPVVMKEVSLYLLIQNMTLGICALWLWKRHLNYTPIQS